MRILFFAFSLLFFLSACKKEKPLYTTLTAQDPNGYTYSYVSEDSLKTRIYTLDNGLKVYLSVYKEAPRVQTYVAVRAGSKSDPAETTGLAHYLEHILFKGTSSLGSINWEAEKPYLDKIEELYEVHRQTKDSLKRAAIYRKIDSLSYIAAQYAIPNEYDRLLATIGATGTNAYTWVEQTVYVNNIPSNQIERWIAIEANRFSEVVPRLFHTELEAVYEEKNRALDSDWRKSWETMMSTLFKKHPYGTQTTLGESEHLKNPSITAIKNYFNTYYVPNNMAICMSGDLDPGETIQLIDKYFGKAKPGDLPAFKPAKEAKIKAPIEKSVYGPAAENVTIGFRIPGGASDEALKMEVVSMLLSNSQAGLMDLHLNQKQRVIDAYSYPVQMNDYSAHLLGAKPRDGQELEEVRDLLLGELEKIAVGDFDDWLLEAIIQDYKISEMRKLESNKYRAQAFVDAFVGQQEWGFYATRINRMERLTKEDIMEFAAEWYDENYVVVYKREGTSDVAKIPKPPITPIEVNRDTSSAFRRAVMSMHTPKIQPVFADFENDLVKTTIGNDSLELLYKENVENSLFSMDVIIDISKKHNLLLPVAIDYLNYLGPDSLLAEDLKKLFFRLGCTYSITNEREKTFVSLNGINENFEEAFLLVQRLIDRPYADEDALKNLKSDLLKKRRDRKQSKNTILTKAMVNYAKFGSESAYTTVLSEEEIEAITTDTLLTIIRNLFSYERRILYYGPEPVDSLVTFFTREHLTDHPLLPLPISEKTYKKASFDKPELFWTDYDMVQAEVVILSRSIKYNKDIVPVASLFNKYFGGNMGSLVFQEIREAKGLAYSVRSRYELATKKSKYNYVNSYIGTQADKLTEAITAMQALLNDMPVSEKAFEVAKTSLQEGIETSRIRKKQVLTAYLNAVELGIDYDIRRDIYTQTRDMSTADILKFHRQYIQNKPHKILLIGSKDRIDLKKVRRFGPVKQLSLEELFGY